MPKHKEPPSGKPRTVRVREKKYRAARRKAWQERKINFAHLVNALLDDYLLYGQRHHRA